MLQKSTSNNRQVQRTKNWIFEALLILMDQKPYDKITVSDIVEKAGIARQTFYRNFKDKNNIIYEHLINTYDVLSFEETAGSKKHYQIVLTFNYGYTLKHRKELTKILSIPNMKYFVLAAMEIIPPEIINLLKESLSKEEYRICRYKLYHQITGCRRIFLDWFLDGMPLPVDKLASIINAMNTLKDKFYRDLPGIVVRIKTEYP